MVNEEGAHINLRGQLDFNYPKKGIPIEEVESVDEIVTAIQDRCYVLRIHFQGGT